MFEFVETPLFTRIVSHYLSDDEYSELQEYLNAHPEAGAVIPGSGGVRKLRWGGLGRGKRGGLRIIYYLRTCQDEIWMLTLSAKNVRENIAAQVLKQIREAIENEENRA